MWLATPALQRKPLPLHAVTKEHLPALWVHHVGVLAVLEQLRVQLGASFDCLQLESADGCSPVACLAAAAASCMQTKKSKGKKAAKAATTEEYADMLSTFLPVLQCQAIQWGFRHLVSVDGASIHRVGRMPTPHPRPRPSSPNYQLGYASTFLPHPAHSPDLHLVIEHRFAELKQHLVKRVYQLGFENVTTAALRLFVMEYCMTITPQLIQADIQNLVKCYQVVRTPIGSSVLINNRSVDGVAGGWPPKHFR